VTKITKNGRKDKKNREKREKLVKSAQNRAKWVAKAIFERFPAIQSQKGLKIRNFISV
jgi:hypothetical protein